MKLLDHKKLVSISLAKIGDAKLLLKIHNCNVKAGFFNSKDLASYKDHIEWYKKKLKSNSVIYVGKNSNKKKFGYVRFDEVKKNIFEVSLGNLPNFYGKGLGSLMLEKSVKKFRKNYKQKKIISVVKKFNERSIKSFLKNTFIKVKFDKKKHFTMNKFNPNKEYYFELE